MELNNNSSSKLSKVLLISGVVILLVGIISLSVYFASNVNNSSEAYLKSQNDLYRLQTDGNLVYDEPEVRLKQIHSQLRIDNGNLTEEIDEQLMASKYLKGYENVLEIGGNIGRNSCVIAYILNRNNNSNLVVLESNPQYVPQLEHNRNINNLNFHIEGSALSKRKLIQPKDGWDTEVTDKDEVPEGYVRVSTISWDKLTRKYPFKFDTLVLDCEGAFYYILLDMPEILDNVNLILKENDYRNLAHHEYVSSTLKQKGFKVVQTKKGPDDMPCGAFFWQVWIRMGTQ